MQYAIPKLLEPTPDLALKEIVLLFYGISLASVDIEESQGDEEAGDTIRAIKILGLYPHAT